jgi:putative ABC transport system permease protein
MRRAVAAAYAVAVGLVGAVLGAAVGFVPGIAISYPLTRRFAPGPLGADYSHTLSIPWLEIVGLVVALPLVTAVLVGLMARSRLPLVARLD